MTGTEATKQARTSSDQPWFVYLLRCCDDTFYCGITNNLAKRVETHNKGKGAKYTRHRWPVALVYSLQHPNWLAAAMDEHRIKRLSRKQKEALIATVQ